MIGGLLVQPADQFPSMFSKTGLFGRFPFLLPNLLLGIFSCIGFWLCLFFLPETLSKGQAYAGENPLPTNREGEGKGTIDQNSTEEPLLGRMEEEGQKNTGIRDPGIWRVVFCEPDTCKIFHILCSLFQIIFYDPLLWKCLLEPFSAYVASCLWALMR